MYLIDVIGTMHVIHVVIALFNEFPVVFGQEKFGMYGTRFKNDKWSYWWCYVVEMNYCASVLLYEIEILSSNYSMAWLYNSSAISWHHPIITCCNFVDESHSQRGRYQSWGWWWSPTTTVCHASGNNGPAPRDPMVYGGTTARAYTEHRSWTGTGPTLGTQTKLV